MQGGDEDLSIQQLASNLFTYREQLQQVRRLLNDEPGNSEYEEMEKELAEELSICEYWLSNYSLSFTLFSARPFVYFLVVVILMISEANIASFVSDIICIRAKAILLITALNKVIALTEELLETAKQSANSELTFSGDDNVSTSLHLNGGSTHHYLDSDVSDQSDKFPVGTKVQAVWSEDGEWYNATIEALTPNGYFVSYEGWGNKEEVDPANVRPLQEGVVDAILEAEKEAEATKLALKRKIAQAAASDSEFQSRSLPEKLRIEPDDPEDVKAAKRKKIHAFKSKVRKEQLEVTQNKRQNAWQQFQTTKGRAKKIGFFSGRKKESIFKSPDDPFGKVGVIGSGKGLTDFQKREKHLHLKAGNAEGMDE